MATRSKSSSRTRLNYLRARDAILEMLAEGAYEEGDRLPSLDKLVTQLGIGRISIYQAIRMLSEEGILRTVPSRGCYVRALPGQRSFKAEEAEDPNQVAQFLSHLIGPGAQVRARRIQVGLRGEWHVAREAWQALAAAFNAQSPDIELEPVGLSASDGLRKEWRHLEADILQVPIHLLPYFVRTHCLFNPEDVEPIGLEDSSFYPGFVEAATWNDVVWGVPGAAAVECQFYRREHEDLAHWLGEAEGFWARLERLAEAARDRLPPGCEALALNNRSLCSLLMNATGRRPFFYEEYLHFERRDLRSFLERLEPYLRNPRVFHRDSEVQRTPMEEYFVQGKGALLFSNSLWHGFLCADLPSPPGVLVDVVEAGGAVALGGHLHVINAHTPFPEECREVLAFLARPETQGLLAERGRIVAHRKGNERLHLPLLGEEDRAALLAGLEGGHVLRSQEIAVDDYVETVLNVEVRHWQDGRISLEALLERLARKTSFYRQSGRTRLRAILRAEASEQSQENDGSMR